MNTLDNFSKNVAKYQQDHKFTNLQMANLLDISLSTYRNIISRRVDKIDLDVIVKVCEITDLCLPELCGIENHNVNLLRKFTSLPIGYRNYIEGKIDFYLSHGSYTENSQRAIPVIVPAGEFVDGMIWISAGEDVLHGDFSKSIYCGVKVTSNHLSPVFVQGDILLLEKRHPKNGEIAIFVNRESATTRAYCKVYKYGNPCIFADFSGCGIDIEVNPNDIHEVSKWLKFGTVVGVWRGGMVENVD